MGFSEVSVLLKVALVLLPIALLLQIIGIATVYWASTEVEYLGAKLNFGLWRICSKSVCVSMPSSRLFSWLDATRALGIIGILLIGTSVVLTILCVFVFNKARQNTVYTLNSVLAFIGGGTFLLSIYIFAVNYNSSLAGNSLSWSFDLSVVAGLMSLVGGGLLTADFRKTS